MWFRPVAFRIRDFRSIVDTGICNLSGDGITALAGQNEAGKTAILTALRDFDIDPDEPAGTTDIVPEHNFDAVPRVAVQFEAEDFEEVIEDLEDFVLPNGLSDFLSDGRRIWIERDLLTRKYSLDPDLQRFWDGEAISSPSTDDSNVLIENPGDSAVVVKPIIGTVEFAAWLRVYWPVFIYFDSFAHTVPRDIELDVLVPARTPTVPLVAVSAPLPPESASPSASDQVSSHAEPPATTVAQLTSASPSPTPPTHAESKRKPRKSAPQAVLDLLELADVDLSKVEALAENDKALGNYLQSRSAHITGDFGTYWKQQVEGRERVEISIRHIRNPAGELKLAFFVRDGGVDQYPEQRSKGFLWFLSFYLRLAAAEKRDNRPDRLILIDEPGSYLHATAQRDVLHLLEERIANKQIVIYSTHSPYLLPPEQLHRIRIVLKTIPEGTVILDRLTHPSLNSRNANDALMPLISSIGLDIRQALSFARPQNLIVEGISDHMYVMSWARMLDESFSDAFNVFPATGASTVPALASLFIGWRLAFVSLLDRDDQGNAARDKLIKVLGVPELDVIQPKDAKDIEDLFSRNDFKRLIGELEERYVPRASETNSATIKRLGIDKVLLARRFAELIQSSGFEPDSESRRRFGELLSSIRARGTVA